jgi:hypothetical protein
LNLRAALTGVGAGGMASGLLVAPMLNTVMPASDVMVGNPVAFCRRSATRPAQPVATGAFAYPLCHSPC